MADSISQQIKKLLKKQPDITNTELYKAFPNVRENTLRHYKSKFADEIATTTVKAGKSTKTKTTPQVKAKRGPKKGVKQSLKEQIYAFLDKKPNATFSELSKAFKDASQHTLRGYKFKYSKEVTPKPLPAPTKTAKAQKAESKTAVSKADLEKRLEAMEAQVEKLLGAKTAKSGTVKTSISAKAKELEGNLLTFIKEKKKGLDELQHHVTSEISSFLNSIKNKKD